jgi:glutaredoxin 3
MIEIYSKPDCGFCKAAKDLLELNDIGYNEYSIGTHLTREEFIEKFPNVKTVPAILVDGFFIGGYNELLNHVTKVKNDSQ